MLFLFLACLGGCLIGLYYRLTHLRVTSSEELSERKETLINSELRARALVRVHVFLMDSKSVISL